MVKRFIKEQCLKIILAGMKNNQEIKKYREDSIYNPYNRMALLKPIKVTKIDKKYSYLPKIEFSMITPVKNEEDNIADFIRSIENQTLLPSELIIVDGGSTDKTKELIASIQATSKVAINLITINSQSISEQRNLAIRTAKNEHIVLADAGNLLNENYCLNLIGCFEEFSDADLVGAIYYALHEECSQYFIYDWNSYNEWAEFLPAGKTMAIKKSLALQVGGFPEHLAYAGEDALFDINYRKLSKHWVFNSEAFVHWDIPRTLEGTVNKFFSYGIGLGESGMGDFRFYEQLMNLRLNKVFSEDSVVVDSLFNGYICGRERRPEIEFVKRSIKGLKVYFITDKLMSSNKEMDRIAGFIQDNYKVILITSDRNFETSKFVEFDTTLLEIYDANDFTYEDLLRRYGKYKQRVSILYKEDCKQNEVLNNLINVANGLGYKTEQV